MQKTFNFFYAFLLALLGFGVTLIAEEITLTTYYPAPYGVYEELTVTGNVGIGTTAPQTVLHVMAQGSGVDNDVIRIEGNGEPNLSIIAASNTSNYNPLIFSGRARDSLASPDPVIAGDTIFEIWGMGYDGNSYEAAGQIKINADGNASNNNMPGNITFGTTFVGETTPHTRVTIKNDGNVGIGIDLPTYQLQLSTDSAAKPSSSAWSIASDKRIKKNISDFTDGLNVIMKLKPHTYQYNGLGGKGYDDTNTHIGLVAQEVEPIAPYMVETSKGTIGGVQVSDFKNYQGHALPFILVNAIQEQQGIIKAQQVEINELKARLDKLEGK